MNQKLKAVSLVLTLAMTTQLTACTDEEIATALGAAAIVAGAVVIANNTECVGGYKTVCHDYEDYWGYSRYECREVYDSCKYITPRKELILVAKDVDSASAANEDLVNEVKWAEAFGTGFDGSALFINALKTARDQKDLTALTDLGLKKSDIKRIAQGQLPTQEGTEALAKSLNQNVKVTSDMIARLVDKAKELKK